MILLRNQINFACVKLNTSAVSSKFVRSIPDDSNHYGSSEVVCNRAWTG
jgi:hypothetical protein